MTTTSTVRVHRAAAVAGGFSYQLNGQRLVLTADATAVTGSTTSVSLTVRDAINEGRAGTIVLQVVPSTRPLAAPAADRAVTQRGQTTVVDVLLNDQATNPFPETPLRVIAIRGLGGAALPDGVTITPSADNSRLSVSVATTAVPGDVNLQYQVADATDTPARYVWGSVTISIQDVPDPVTGVRVSEFGDRLLKLAWVPGQFNNSPITGYEVTMTSAADGSPLGVTTCTTTVGCELRTPGNGPSNAVRLSVVAINDIGPSASAALSGSIWSDIIPPPPSSLGWRPLDQGLRITWAKPDVGAGSPIETYVVTVGGVTQSISVDPSDPVGTKYSRNIQAPSIANGRSIGFSVSARNSAPNSLATWNEATGAGVPAGPPIPTAAPTASGSITDGTTASIAWDGAFSGNGATITDYWVAIYTGSAPVCTVTGVEVGNPDVNPPTGPGIKHVAGGVTSTGFGGLTPNTTYQMTVFAYNGQGCVASTTVPVTPRAAPGPVTAVSTAGPVQSSPSTWDFRLDGFTIGSGSTDADTFQYRLIGGSTDQSASGIVAPGTLLTTGNGSHYGNALSVQVKACKAYPEATLCSANWSASFALGGVAVSNAVPGGLQSVVTQNDGLLDSTGYWSWGSLPVGADYAGVSATCGPDDDPGTPSQCEVHGGLLGLSFPDLVITIAANGTTYSRSYDWNDY
ncbi:MAG: fibronectin type III domain-containing protein [Schumannella sp.]